jgi:glutaredoxin 3
VSSYDLLESILSALNGLARLSARYTQLTPHARRLVLGAPALLARVAGIREIEEDELEEGEFEEVIEEINKEIIETKQIKETEELLIQKRINKSIKEREETENTWSNRTACLIWSLSQLGIIYTELPRGTQRALWCCIDAGLPDMSNYAMSWTLWSLARMHVSYIDWPHNARVRLIAYLTDLSEAGHDTSFWLKNQNEIGVLLWALVTMNVPLQDLPVAIIERLMTSIDSISRQSRKQNFNSYIYVYTKPGCKYCEIAKEKLRKMNLEFVEYDISQDSLEGIDNTRLQHALSNRLPQIYVGNDYIGGCENFLLEMVNGIFYKRLKSIGYPIKQV